MAASIKVAGIPDTIRAQYDSLPNDLGRGAYMMAQESRQYQRSSGDMKLLKFPNTKNILWDHTSTGSSLHLHISCYRKPKLFVSEKVLRFAQRHLESTGQSSCSSTLIGSLAIDDGCHRLGDLIELVKKDFTKAAMVYKMNCDENKYGHSCYKYAQYNLAGLGVEKNLEEGLKYHSIGCELGFTAACHNGGMLHLGSIVSGKSDPIKGADFLARSCEKKDSDSCARLGESYLKGLKQLQQDKTKAFEYIKKACELENYHGCHNLSVMYKKGDGVMQNSEMAEMYKQKTLKIIDSMKNPKTKLRFGE